MDISKRYGNLYRAELNLRWKILQEKNQEEREKLQKNLDCVVANMVEIEKQLEAEWFAAQEKKE